MFSKWKKESTQAAVAQYTAGKRMYCIGDIHGRADLLAGLHDTILADAADFDGQCQILYLGDFVDRGEQSRQVLDMLIEVPLKGFEPFYLMGNHERAMLDFMIDPLAMAGWLTWGGVPTLHSYGIYPSPAPSREEIREISERMRTTIPRAHVEFLESCIPAYAEGGYYFVHAGIKPGRALDKQRIEDQFWIRDEFLTSTRDHGAVVVHGHTISEDVEIHPNRIGMDTGAYHSGVLSCLVLEASERRLLQTGKNP